MTAAVKESVAASKKYIDEVVGNVVSTQKQQMDELLKLAPPELKKAMASGDSDLFMAALGQAVIGASPKEMAAWKAKVAESVNSKEVEALIASAAKKAMDELEEKGQDAEGALAKQLARRAKQSTFHTVVKWTAIALGTVAGIAVLFEIGCALTGRNGFLVKRNFSNEELLNMMEQNNSKQNRIDA